MISLLTPNGSRQTKLNRQPLSSDGQLHTSLRLFARQDIWGPISMATEGPRAHVLPRTNRHIDSEVISRQFSSSQALGILEKHSFSPLIYCKVPENVFLPGTYLFVFSPKWYGWSSCCVQSSSRGYTGLEGPPARKLGYDIHHLEHFFRTLTF